MPIDTVTSNISPWFYVFVVVSNVTKHKIRDKDST